MGPIRDPDPAGPALPESYSPRRIGPPAKAKLVFAPDLGIWYGSHMRRRFLLALVLLRFLHASQSLAARIDLAPSQAEPGATVEMCGFLSGNTEIAALQLTLGWDSRCVAPVLSGSSHQCSTLPTTGKSLLTRLGDEATTVMLIALSNSSPIPNGPLFCCSFVVSASPPAASCPMPLSAVTGSTASGTKLSNIVAQGASLSFRQDSSSEPRFPSAPVAPIGDGPGVVLSDGGPARNDEDKRPPQPTIAPPTAPRAEPAPTAVQPALAPIPRQTPAEGQPDFSEAAPELEAVPNPDGAASDDPSTPTARRGSSTPLSTSTAATPTRPAQSTATRPSATQTISPGSTRPATTMTPAR